MSKEKELVEMIRSLIRSARECLDYKDGSGRPILYEAIDKANAMISELDESSPAETKGGVKWCRVCNGTGFDESTIKDKCPNCNGTGMLDESTAPSKEFVWTEELILKYAELYRFSSGRMSIKQFKESKDWQEVVNVENLKSNQP